MTGVLPCVAVSAASKLAITLLIFCAMLLPVALIWMFVVAVTRLESPRRWYMVGALVLGIGGVLMLSRQSVRMMIDESPEVVCNENLTRIGKVCLDYASQHDGWLPPDKDAVFDLVGRDPGKVVCPMDKKLYIDIAVMKDAAAPLIEASPSYVYVGGYNLKDVAGHEGSAIIAYGRAVFHQSMVGYKYRGVVFADGHVSYLVESTFYKALAAHQALFDKTPADSLMPSDRQTATSPGPQSAEKPEKPAAPTPSAQ